MANYNAIIKDMRWPCGYIKHFEGKRIDSINRAILSTGKTWEGLQLPKSIKRGRYFSASYDGIEIQIFKD